MLRDRKRPYFIVFRTLGSDSITVVFRRIVNDRKRSDSEFSSRIWPLVIVYDTVAYGRNTIAAKRVKYDPYTVVYGSMCDGSWHLRSP